MSSNTETFAQMERWAQDIATLLTPKDKKQITRKIAQELRKNQQSNIKAQRSPDGQRFQSRKRQIRTRKGSIRRNQDMFKKLRQTRQLKLISSPEYAVVKITGRAARIARVHQYGLESTVNKEGLKVRYAQRELLGHNSQTHEIAINVLLDHFA